MHAHTVCLRLRGFVLVELALGLALVMLAAIWSASRYAELAHETAARASGTWMLEVRRGVVEWLGTHYDVLAAHQTPVGADGHKLFAEPGAPTLSELRAAGHLPADFPLRSALGFGANVVLRVAPACPGPSCRIDALIVSDQPLIVASGEPDSVATAEIIMSLQGWGGHVDALSPARVRGASINLPNPLGRAHRPWPVGTVAAWVGLDRSSMLAYLRVGDERDPQFKGDVSVAGRVVAPGVAAGHVEAQVIQSGRLASTGDITAGGAIAAGGDLTVSGAVRGATLHAEGAVTAGGYVVPQGRADAGAACKVTGALARDGAGGLLICEAGAWRRASDGFGGAFATNSVYGCQDARRVSQRNPRTGGCSCPPGYQAVQLYADFWYGTDEWRAAFICIR